MPLISIIIPTRNRYEYLLDTVRLTLDRLDDVEIVVCDNSDSTRLGSDLAPYIDEGSVVYRYSSQKLSVVDNFENALKLSSGSYVLFIGDDDAIGPGLSQICSWALAHDVDAVVSYGNRFIANYFWPGVSSKYFGDGYESTLFISKFSGIGKKIDTKRALKQVCQHFGGGLGELPRAYHGLISRTLINKIYKKYGALFGGVSPDIYSATLIATECSSAYYIDFPFVIPGASTQSTAGEGAAKTDSGDLKSREHISRFGDSLKWEPKIPAFYAPQTVWAYSLFVALKKVSPELSVVNFGRLYAKCFIYHSNHFNFTKDSFTTWKSEFGTVKAYFELFLGFAAEGVQQFKRIVRFLFHPRAGASATRVSNVTKISDAYEKLENHIHSEKIRISLEGEIVDVGRGTLGKRNIL